MATSAQLRRAAGPPGRCHQVVRLRPTAPEGEAERPEVDALALEPLALTDRGEGGGAGSTLQPEEGRDGVGAADLVGDDARRCAGSPRRPAWVCGPKIPSTRPESNPSVPSRSWRSATSSPRSIGERRQSSRSPSRCSDSTSAAHVVASQTPVGSSPRERLEIARPRSGGLRRSGPRRRAPCGGRAAPAVGGARRRWARGADRHGGSEGTVAADRACGVRRAGGAGWWERVAWATVTAVGGPCAHAAHRVSRSRGCSAPRSARTGLRGRR